MAVIILSHIKSVLSSESASKYMTDDTSTTFLANKFEDATIYFTQGTTIINFWIQLKNPNSGQVETRFYKILAYQISKGSF